MNLGDDVNLLQIAEKCQHFTGADFKGKEKFLIEFGRQRHASTWLAVVTIKLLINQCSYPTKIITQSFQMVYTPTNSEKEQNKLRYPVYKIHMKMKLILVFS